MKHRLILLASIVGIMFASTAAFAQSLAGSAGARPAEREAYAVTLSALRRLEADVIVYRSLADFEASGKLARVSLQIFEERLRDVNATVEPLLDRMPPGKSKSELANALDSYRDGLFWWRQIDQPRVVNVSTLRYESKPATADADFQSSIPYTVAIHWRQAQKYLNQAAQDRKQVKRANGTVALQSH